MKKITERINHFLSAITNNIENSIIIFSEDSLLIVFLITSIIAGLFLKISSSMNVFDIRAIIFDFVWFALASAISFKFKSRKKRGVYFTVVTLAMYGLTYGNLMYNRYYSDFLSLSQIKLLKLFKDVANATTTTIYPVDFFYWFCFALSVAAISYVSRSKRFNEEEPVLEKRRFRKKTFYKTALIGFATGILTLTPANYSQAVKMWNRPLVVENFGLYTYHVLDIVNSAASIFKPSATPGDYQQFIDYFDNKDAQPDYDAANAYTNILKGQNIIVIHAESLQNFLINMAFDGTNIGPVSDMPNGQVLTPNFNALANSGLYFSNYFSQQSIGTSADSEFVFNTSLLPLNSGTVFLNNYNYTYYTTQNILRDHGYYTMYMHGNYGSFWNRDMMYPSMGYDIFYNRDNAYTVTPQNTIGLGISDYAFFQQSMEYLNAAASMGQPFYATLITLSNHTPWDDTAGYVTYNPDGSVAPQIDCGDLTGTTTCRYLQSVHYADWAFGQFFNMLKTQGLLSNTAIVVYGDHPASLPISDMETLYHEPISKIQNEVDDRVPFMIYDKNIKPQVITKVMGEFDVGPTLQNMLGVKENKFALGNDIFSITDNLVPFINGNWTDGNIYYDAFENDYYIMNPNFTDADITPDYISERNAKVSQMINISNLINHLDLIAMYDKDNNITHVGSPSTGGE